MLNILRIVSCSWAGAGRLISLKWVQVHAVRDSVLLLSIVDCMKLSVIVRGGSESVIVRGGEVRVRGKSVLWRGGMKWATLLPCLSASLIFETIL